jgi:hypothetical protein
MHFRSWGVLLDRGRELASVRADRANACILLENAYGTHTGAPLHPHTDDHADDTTELVGVESRAMSAVPSRSALAELFAEIGPAPCDGCWHAARCGAKHLACEAFRLYMGGAREVRWSIVKRTPTREHYEALM